MATNQEIVLKILGKKPILNAKIPAIAESQTPFTKKCCMCGELVNFISFCTDKCVVDCKNVLKDPALLVRRQLHTSTVSNQNQQLRPKDTNYYKVRERMSG